MRTHISLPEALVGEIERLVGKRKRSRFITEAIQEKLEREALLLALKDTAGILAAGTHPDWSTPGEVARWQRKIRRQDETRLKRRARHG